MPKKLITLALIVIYLQGCKTPQDDVFTHDIQTNPKPWTHEHFKNDPDNFQFAIVSDRTGGRRPGIFVQAMQRLNWLQPEFVLCVGDLINGYSENLEMLHDQWDEVQERTESLEMPFFYVAGNHDITNQVMRDLWRQKFGVNYYSFVYRDVLFLILDSQDGDPESGFHAGLSPDQIAYMRQALAEHDDVRWTLLFFHQPLWLYDEEEPDADTAFSQITAALNDRPYTVFAGHRHEYARYERHNHYFYMLSTTGGGSSLRGPFFGELDHVTWVTMTDDGPRLANLALDGILPDDFRTETQVQFLESLATAAVIGDTPDALSGQLQLELENHNPDPLKVALDWQIPQGCPWTIQSPQQEIVIAPGDQGVMNWPIQFIGDRAKLDTRVRLPWATADATIGDRVLLAGHTITISQWAREELRIPSPAMVCRLIETAPRIDAVLDDSAWPDNPDIPRFVRTQLDGPPSASTSAWVAYDAQGLYLAVRCAEPNPADMHLGVTHQDGPVWTDDGIEIFIDTNYDRQSFHQAVINAKGVTYAGTSAPSFSWQGAYQSATAMTDQGWVLEVAINWKSLGLDGPPAPGSQVGLNLIRNRPQAKVEITQWSPTFYGNWKPELFGTLKF